MAEYMNPAFRRDDYFYKRLNIKIKRLDYLASAVRRRIVNAVPIFWAELWDLIPIIEKGRKDKTIISRSKCCLETIGENIDTKKKKIYNIDVVRHVILEIYLQMRGCMFILELKQDEEELTPSEILLEAAFA